MERSEGNGSKQCVSASTPCEEAVKSVFCCIMRIRESMSPRPVQKQFKMKNAVIPETESSTRQRA